MADQYQNDLQLSIDKKIRSVQLMIRGYAEKAG